MSIFKFLIQPVIHHTSFCQKNTNNKRSTLMFLLCFFCFRLFSVCMAVQRFDDIVNYYLIKTALMLPQNIGHFPAKFSPRKFSFSLCRRISRVFDKPTKCFINYTGVQTS